MPTRAEWLTELREAENEKRAAEQDELTDERAPLHPMRLYHELQQVLDRDAIVIGDGGDFVSYAGRVIDIVRAGHAGWTRARTAASGSGPGYAIAAKLARPTARSACCSATARSASRGWSSTRWCATASRSSAVMGNNGIWALEKHPMEFLYGYSVAADLQPECRYDQVVEALGGHGELVSAPEELRPALERAFASGKPALVNVLTDPDRGLSAQVQPGLTPALYTHVPDAVCLPKRASQMFDG